MRKLAFFAFSFSAAIFISKYAFHSDWLLPAAVIFAALGLLSLFLKGDIRLKAMLIAFGLAAGFAWNFTYFSLFIKPFSSLDGQTATITAEVTDYPRETKYGISVYVKTRSEKTCFEAKTLLYADIEYNKLSPGDIITLNARIRFADFAFGEETDYYTSNGVFFIANARGDITVKKAPKLPLKYYPQYFTKIINSKISDIYQEDTMPFMTALITGERSLLNKDDPLTSAMSSAGVTHVVAVSGMHITFLAGFIMLLMRKKRLGALICTPVILIFMAMVGNTPSVVRAGIMQMFLLYAPLFNRESDSITSLGAALMLLLLINPYSASNVGLQLSFASIFGITLFSQGINGYLLKLKEGRKLFEKKYLNLVWRVLAATLSSTLGAIIFTTPLVALYFNIVSLAAPLANLLILWSVSYAFLGGLLSIALGFIFLPAGKVAAWIISLLVRYIILIVKLISRFRFASISMLSIFTRIWLVFTYLVFLRLYMIRKRGPRLIIPASSIVIVLCLSLLLSGYKTDISKMSVTAVDVGQGESIVITTKGHTFVVDCGGDKSSNVGNNTYEYLWSVNRSVIDVLVLTHFDSDHINGVTQLMQKTKIKLIAVPDSVNSREDSENNREKITSLVNSMGIEVLYINNNMRLSSGDACLTLYPVKGSAGDNDNGLIALCSAGDYDTLITGDADSAVERRFINTEKLPDIELLIVGHHGSKYSTSNELLDSLKPEKAIISVGYNNYGHPSREVLDRLSSKSIEVLRTDDLGNVTVRFD